MQWIDSTLIICGDGNFMNETIQLVKKYRVEHKVIFKGMLEPEELRKITQKAYIGTTFCTKDSLSTYFSLANRFFDYLQAYTPQVCVKFPAYEELNNLHGIAVLVDNVSPEGIAASINELLHNDKKWQQLHENCINAAKELNWETEEKKLIHFYKNIFG
jgi:glycosyltransferase involved in cell wall biosynthesis